MEVGLHESIKVVEAGYGIMLAPSFSVTNSIENQKFARLYIDGIDIKQSLFICTRKNETIEHLFIEYLKENLYPILSCVSDHAAVLHGNTICGEFCNASLKYIRTPLL
ncbi:hypothetical protein FJQ98_20995 [Lysinibacillus agricola]|uniref:LysR substrate-binding domain-containing protein n=1 Tax=Lysinibacillus agricola TaxID=2590012 RepID=A0ABX7ANW9_9BACI|nr:MULTISPECIES: hypothetical protein [Lysinibacillus]KOS60393.1 hypothetical protein AN161_23265 [Lysinibacillus sp. FJAT-14222]QQP11641.1 hypothetical protein FJQ98_20995 [Lysinibacillus agricola]